MTDEEEQKSKRVQTVGGGNSTRTVKDNQK